MADKTMKMEYIPSKGKIANIFTKPLAREPFEYMRRKLGIVPTDYSQQCNFRRRT